MAVKKLAFLCCMSVSSLYAGGMGQYVESNTERYQTWELGIEALYLKPSLTNFGYLGYTNNGENNQGGHRVLQYIEPDADWGMRVEGKYFFDVGSNVKLSWSGFSNTTKDAFQIDYDSNNGVPNDPVVTRQKVKWDDLRLEVEHILTFDDNKHLRFHGGLEYSKMESDRTVYTYLVGTTVTPNTSSANATSTRLENFDFKGIGPVVGVDAMYDVTDCFQIYAKGSSALLVGSSTYDGQTTFTTTSNVNTRGGKLTNSIVPAFMVDLGASYLFDVDYGELGVSAGWRLYSYLNPFLNASTFGQTDYITPGVGSNFALQGAYVGLKWLA